MSHLVIYTGSFDPITLGHLDVLDRSRSHLLQLVNDVLDLSKLEANQLIVEFAPTDLPALLDEVVATMRPRGAEKGLRVDLRYRTPCPRTLLTDGMRVRQILLNLVGNAVKFTAAGGVTVELDATIDDDGDACLAIHVVDTGMGVAPDRQAALFEPFVQADATTTRRFGGTGLGLAITRRLARAMGGDVTVESVEGKGSCFTLTTPFTPAPSAEPELWTPAPSRSGQKGVLLVIEDEPSARDLLRRQAPNTFQLCEVRTGSEGVAAARALLPDAIVLDICLPDMSGWDVLDTLRADPVTAGIPVIVLSGVADRQEAMAHGAEAHFAKPADRTALFEAVCAAADRARETANVIEL